MQQLNILILSKNIKLQKSSNRQNQQTFSHLNKIIKLMEEFELTQSLIQDEQKNQFLGNDIQYQNCPHCERNFFLGKLKFHLKLCKPSNPMIKSPVKRNKHSLFSATIQKSTPFLQQQKLQANKQTISPQIKYKKCDHCRATFPVSMIKKHQQKCNLKYKMQNNSQNDNKLKAKTKTNFQPKMDIKQPSSALPRIRNSAKQQSYKQRTLASQDSKDLKPSYTVRIRQELSCFKKALEVQQIQCNFCSRKFSKEASLRHIPICEKLKSQQIHQIALKKNSKSQVYKINVPPRKNILFRSKMMASANQKPHQQIQIQSARQPKNEKSQRQKINNTSFMKNGKPQQESIKPLNVQSDQYSKKQTSLKFFAKRDQKQPETQRIDRTQSKKNNQKKFNYAQTIELNPQHIQNFDGPSQTPLFDQPRRSSTQNLNSGQEKQSQTQNQFLQVSQSKKNFFNQINLDEKQTISFSKQFLSDQKQGSASPQKIKLKIDLKDFQR